MVGLETAARVDTAGAEQAPPGESKVGVEQVCQGVPIVVSSTEQQSVRGAQISAYHGGSCAFHLL